MIAVYPQLALKRLEKLVNHLGNKFKFKTPNLEILRSNNDFQGIKRLHALKP